MNLKTIYIFLILSCITYGNDVAWVIYREAGPQCSNFERFLVASVIKNRMNNKHFGNKKSMLKVVSAKGQFCSYTANRNSNADWIKNKETYAAYQQAMLLSNRNFTPYKNIVFFHDKSISKPESWKNTQKILETSNFVFYSIK